MRTTNKAVIAGASMACAAALVIAGTGIANAANSLPAKPSASQSDDGDGVGPGHGMRGPRGPIFGDLVAKGTITQAQADAIKAALDAQRTADQAAHDKAEADVLASLVSAGTITQAQADAIAKADRVGIRDLIAAGTITQAQAQALRNAMQALHDQDAGPAAKVDAVLAALVAKGTITQAQADAIKANAPRFGKRGPGDRGMGDRGMGDRGMGRGHHGRGEDRGDDDGGRAPMMPRPSASSSAS